MKMFAFRVVIVFVFMDFSGSVIFSRPSDEKDLTTADKV